ncbi:MAG: DUF420 domain-containing protein [Myxococcota bacterium]
MTSWVNFLPTLNAVLNSIAFCLLILGYVLIRRGEREAHKKVMLAALTTSALFLTSYLIYHAEVGSVKFTGEGLVRTIYFLILVPHIVLAALMVPFILLLLYRALKGEFDKHKKVARPTLAVWIYVSLTGVLVYLMLYQLYPPTPAGVTP